MKKLIILSLVFFLTLSVPLTCFGGQPFPSMGMLKQGRDYNVYPFTENKSKPKLPTINKANAYLDYCPICEGYGELTIRAPGHNFRGPYDCPKCRGLGFIEVRGKNSGGHYFPGKVLYDQVFNIRNNNNTIEGTIDIIDSNGESFERGTLDIRVFFDGVYTRGGIIKWTYKNDSHEQLVDRQVQHGRPFSLNLINDEEMLLRVEFLEYFREKEIKVRIYHEQFEKNS